MAGLSNCEVTVEQGQCLGGDGGDVSLRGGLGGVAQIENFEHWNQQGTFDERVDRPPGSLLLIEHRPAGSLVGMIEQCVLGHEGIHRRAIHLAIQFSADMQH